MTSKMAKTLMAMALTSSLMVIVAVASELSAATENRADFTVHSHNKKVSFLSFHSSPLVQLVRFLNPSSAALPSVMLTISNLYSLKAFWWGVQ